MADGHRTLRVAERVRTELSLLLARSVRDPDVGGITVTAVRMSADLQLARVYYTIAGDGDRRRAARGLRRARPFLRRGVGRGLQLRQVPDIRFLYDDSAERQDRVARLFDTLDRGRAAAGPAADSGDGSGGGGTENDDA